MKVYGCIAKVSADIAKEGIGKGRCNEQQGYAFRGIDDVYNALAPVLAKHGLVILPRMLSRLVTERVTAKGGVLFSVVVDAEFDFVASEDGSKHVIKTYGEAMDSGDKATNKAMSAAYKYAAMQAFCIPTEGDNDADSHTHEEIVPERDDAYDDWLVDMASVAESQGYAALVKAIAASVEGHRARLKATGGKQWAAMKVRAEKFDAKEAVPA